jgi:hypothetical protein
MTTPQIYVENRIPAIDTLRVMAIIVLMFYHHFMIYVPEWGFHYKVETDWVWLQHLMIITSPWRMGLLWLISGIALSFMLSKITIPKALLTRSSQLLFPLLIGVLFIVPPQLFVEMKQAGEMPLHYGQFTYALFFDQGALFTNFEPGIWPSIDVNHLWYLRSLWQFTLLAIIIYPLLRSKLGARCVNVLGAKMPLILVCVFSLDLLIHYTQTGNDVREWFGFVWFFTGLLFGRLKNFWAQASHYAKPLALIALVSLLTLQFGYAYVWKDENASEWARMTMEVLYVLNRAIMPIAVMASIYRWFNVPYAIIQRLNPLVLPLYIVHQTLSILVAFSLSYHVPMLTGYQHFSLSTIAALVTCLMVLMLIERYTVLHPFFGISIKGKSKAFDRRLLAAMLCCSVPIGSEILV